MKDKKRYEVKKLSSLIHHFVESNNIDLIIDLGSGMGQLASFLSFSHSVSILGIDCNKKVILRSIEKNNEFENKFLSKDETTKKQNQPKFHQTHSHIDANISVEEFEKLIYEATKFNPNRVMLIGLHTCGQLGVTVLELMQKSWKDTKEKSKIKVIANIPCCYHKNNMKYPLSRFMKKKKDFKITKGGFHLSIQSIQKWIDANVSFVENKKTGKVSRVLHCNGARLHCKRNSFRSGLEYYLNKNVKNQTNNPFTIGRISKKHLSSFGQYTIYALEKIIQKHKQYVVPDALIHKIKNEKEEFINELNEFYSETFHPNKNGIVKEVEVFWILRACCSKIFENLILIDRILFLEENGFDSELIKVFDPKISPRNHLIFGKIKEDKKIDSP